MSALRSIGKRKRGGDKINNMDNIKNITDMNITEEHGVLSEPTSPCGIGLNRLKSMAKRGDMMPRGLSLSEQKAFQALRCLYAHWKSGDIDTAAASNECDEITHSLIMEQSKEAFLERSASKLQERIFKSSEAFEKNPTVENAKEMYSAFWGGKPFVEKGGKTDDRQNCDR